MKRVMILFASAAFAAAGIGCSTPPANEPQATDANTAAITSFENITDPNAALAEGKRLLDENQTELAIAALKQAIKLDPALAEAHFQLGIAYALLEMQMQLEGTASEPASNSKEGRTKTNSEKSFERAVEAYKKWIDDNPKDDVANYNLGRAYAKLMKDEEAEKAFRQAVKLKPEDAEYQTELGAILIKLAQYHEAIDPLKEAVKLDPENVRAQELLEDAEAGRRRIDYVSPKNTNQSQSRDQNTNSNAAVSSNSNSNTAIRLPANSNSKNSKDEPKPKPVRSPARPN